MAAFPEGLFSAYAKSLTKAIAKNKSAGPAKGKFDDMMRIAKRAYERGDMAEYNKVRDDIRQMIGDVSRGKSTDAAEVKKASLESMSKGESAKVSPAKSKEWSPEEIEAQVEADFQAQKKKIRDRQVGTAERQLSERRAVGNVSKELDKAERSVAAKRRNFEKKGIELGDEYWEKELKRRTEGIMSKSRTGEKLRTTEDVVEEKELSIAEKSAIKQTNKRRRAKGLKSMNDAQVKEFVETGRIPNITGKNSDAAANKKAAAKKPAPKAEPVKKTAPAKSAEKKTPIYDTRKSTTRTVKSSKPLDTRPLPDDLRKKIGKLGGSARARNIKSSNPYADSTFKAFVKRYPKLSKLEMEKAWRDGWHTE